MGVYWCLRVDRGEKVMNRWVQGWLAIWPVSLGIGCALAPVSSLPPAETDGSSTAVETGEASMPASALGSGASSASSDEVPTSVRSDSPSFVPVSDPRFVPDPVGELMSVLFDGLVLDVFLPLPGSGAAEDFTFLELLCRDTTDLPDVVCRQRYGP
ncbi:MAG: hypothetical protein D6788_09250 [Planctomycetota bacterium]|nr:MAG: hypothetical protein D6788_09250 [Planctomycetota bacterium]